MQYIRSFEKEEGIANFARSLYNIYIYMCVCVCIYIYILVWICIFTYAYRTHVYPGRVLSLDWNIDDTSIVSGSSDSSIRFWNPESGRCKLRIQVQDEKKDATLVWAVRFIDENVVVSGDSLGRVQFWDSKHGTLRQVYDPIYTPELKTFHIPRN